MQVLRTSDSCFAALPDYPFEPHYTEIIADSGEVLRIHHIDEGDRQAPVVLLLHGQPSWSYLYRKMVPLLVQQGLRVIAPDLPGYGKSDKPAAREDYSYQRQVDWMGAWLVANDLSDITFFGQDWGGLIGLRLVVDHPARFARVVIGNTALPINTNSNPELVAKIAQFRSDGQRLSLPAMSRVLSRLPRIGFEDQDAFPMGFAHWQKFSWETVDMPAGFLMEMMIAPARTWRVAPRVLLHHYLGLSLRPLTPLGRAYEAPFPAPEYKMGPRAMPSQVPTLPTDPSLEAQAKAWEFYEQFEKPFLCLFTADDPVTRGAEKSFIGRVPGTRGLDHQIFERGGHFLQEQRHHELSDAISSLIHAT
jgi:haloalkane dehalogenase